MRHMPLLAAIALLPGGCLSALPEDPTGSGVDPGFAPGTPSAFRVLSVPQRDGNYQHFASQVIDARSQYESFKESVERQAYAPERFEFLHVLAETRIDFDRESLVLIRHEEGSGSLSVSLAPPQLWGNTLACTIRVSGRPWTRDMQECCFALVVDKRRVRRVQVWVKEGLLGELRETLSVASQQQ